MSAYIVVCVCGCGCVCMPASGVCVYVCLHCRCVSCLMVLSHYSHITHTLFCSCLCSFVAHHTTSHHISSRYITSHQHHTTSHHITSHHIAPHHITSHHIVSQLLDSDIHHRCDPHDDQCGRVV